MRAKAALIAAVQAYPSTASLCVLARVLAQVLAHVRLQLLPLRLPLSAGTRPQEIALMAVLLVLVQRTA
jgi:hypothetical protein